MVSGLSRDGKMSINAMYNELAFKKKNSRIDWRKIAAVDLDRVARDMDVYTLQENIDHITFCNIETELDTRMMDPNYIKLFKISQYIIEYLIHSQNYLTEVIGSMENQFSQTKVERDELKKSNEKIQKDLIEAKKENKRRRKMIETQQALMNVTSTNYHQCAYCSKVFLNISYLQAHIIRRHPEFGGQPAAAATDPKIIDMQKELERIKERLYKTEAELAAEKNMRAQPLPQPQQQQPSELAALLSHQLEEKNKEIKRIGEELKKSRAAMNNEMHELTEKNVKLEKSVRELEERLGKQSHVGWIKDDVEVEKDSVIKLTKENDELKKKIAEMKEKMKEREKLVKEHYHKQLQEKEKEISELKERLQRLQNSTGNIDDDRLIEIKDLRAQVNYLEQQLDEARRLQQQQQQQQQQPPRVTPRKMTDASRSPSPPKVYEVPAYQAAPSSHIHVPDRDLILLPDHCPLTLRAVDANRDHLKPFRAQAITIMQSELDELGIDKNAKGLSKQEFNQTMRELREFRETELDQDADFEVFRREFEQICDKHVKRRMIDTAGAAATAAIVRSVHGGVGGGGTGGSRVTFKNEMTNNKNRYNSTAGGVVDAYNVGPVTESAAALYYNNNNNNSNKNLTQSHQRGHQPSNSNNRQMNSSFNQASEETEDDFSSSKALDSFGDDLTDPTRSHGHTRQQQPQQQQQQQRASNNRNSDLVSPRKGPRVTGNMYPDENSDLESISQIFTDRSTSRKKALNPSAAANMGGVSEKKMKLEKEFEMNAKKAVKPSPNAVPIHKLAKQEDSFSNISDLENELNNGTRPKSGLRSSLQDSQSSSVWVSESHSNEPGHHHQQQSNTNNNNHNHGVPERPATANSSKTIIFDSDDNENFE